MKTINIDDDVCAELDGYVTHLFSHSDVIRKLLKMTSLPKTDSPVAVHGDSSPPGQVGGIVAFLRGTQYRAERDAIDKYLAVLGWIRENRPNKFGRILEFKRGNRVYFANSQQAVEQGGEGAIHAKQIPGSDVWALSTLDNRTKRQILFEVLQLCDFQAAEIQSVIETIPDSGRHRNGSDRFVEF